MEPIERGGQSSWAPRLGGGYKVKALLLPIVLRIETFPLLGLPQLTLGLSTRSPVTHPWELFWNPSSA